MRACQLCGAKSWGPEKTPHPEAAKLSGHFLECDGCGALAREDLISEPFGLAVDSSVELGIMPGPAHLDPISAASAVMKGILSQKDPETRLERLVRELLGGAVLDTSPRAIVEYAVLVDEQLTRHESAVRTADLKPRDFGTDFLLPALKICSNPQGSLGLALDCAVAFGALEALTGNNSLSKVPELDRVYWEKVERLKALTS